MGYLAALAAAVVFTASDFPVTARVVSGAHPQVELTNTGGRAVTAWTFAVVSPTATGTHRETHSADVYLSEVTHGLPNSNQHLDWLRPGQSRALPIDAAPAGATVELVAVVLDDGSAYGDPEAVNAVFAHRAAERDELKQVVGTFNGVLQERHGMAALDELKQRFAASAGDESVPHRSAREAIDMWLRKANTATRDEDLERAVRTYVAFVQRQYDAAVKHAGRKSGG